MRSMLPILLCLAAGCASQPKAGEPKDWRNDREWILRANPTFNLHQNPKVGQFWELTTYFSYSADWRIERWVVSKRVDDCLIVELQVTLGGAEGVKGSFPVDAYLIEPTKGDATVLRAWIGRFKGEVPIEVYVSPTPRNPSDPKDMPKLVEELKFSEGHLGRTFQGTVLRYSRDDYYPTIWEHWYAEDGWFGGLYKFREVNKKDGSVGYRAELTAFGTDGESWIGWKGVDTRPGYMMDRQWSIVPR